MSMCVCVLCLFYKIILVPILSQCIAQMAISLPSCPFPFSPAGWPPLDSVHSETQGFRCHISDLGLGNAGRNLLNCPEIGIYLIVLIELRKISHHIPELSNLPEQNKQEPEWPLGDYHCPQQSGSGYSGCDG